MGIRSWVLRSLRVVVSSRCAAVGAKPKIGIASGRAEPGARKPVGEADAAALASSSVPGRAG